MIEQIQALLSTIPGVKAFWELLEPWSKSMTIGKLTGAIAAGALCVIAYVDYQERQFNVQWREGAAERQEAEAQREAEQMREFAELNASLMLDKVMASVKAEAEADAEEEVASAKRYLLNRLARNRSLLNCFPIPSHVLSDVHETPLRFRDDREVMEAYNLLVLEDEQTLQYRRQASERLLQTMAEATGSDELPALPTFAAEFTVRCY